MKLGVNTAWFEGLSSEDRDKMREIVLSSTNLLDKLREILYNISRRVEEVSPTDYDSPSWSHKQAHRNGQLDVIRQLTRILTITERADQAQE